MAISGLDHVALTSADIEGAVDFYRHVLDAEHVRDLVVDGVLVARQLRIGAAMLNIHREGNNKAKLVARVPTPGSGDICFRWNAPIADAVALLQARCVEILTGPVERFGSDGVAARSVYFRDLDGNLLELLSSV
jgi:catechol 2,3-dioxygenase-like lactoylglutathione lyase family enzyme